MKIPLISFLAVFAAVFLLPEPLDARSSGNKNKKPNASKKSKPASSHSNRNSSSKNRNPLTQSRVTHANRQSSPIRGVGTSASQASRPKPAAKPNKKPSAKPNNRPSSVSNRQPVKKPSQKPNSRPSSASNNRKPNNNQKGNSGKNHSKGKATPPQTAIRGVNYSNFKPSSSSRPPSPGSVRYPSKPKPKPPTRKPSSVTNRPGGNHSPNRPGSGSSHGGKNHHVSRPNSHANRGSSHHSHHSPSRPNRVNQVITSNRVTNQVSNNWDQSWKQSNTVWNQNYTSIRGPVVVNNNYRNSLNYAHRPDAWGSRPWWCSQSQHNWHHGSWNYGYNNRYNNRHAYLRPPVSHSGYLPGYHSSRPSISSAIPWGIAAWSLGKLAFDTGYSSYRNPYTAPPVQTRTTVYNYSQPITVVASKEKPLPQSEEENDAEKSSAALERSRTLFSQQDYLGALKAVDESISYVPGDPALHEFRALALFALGQYGEAAGVLNPVLAAGPGWDWTTMIGFYNATESYTGQLRKLEDYFASNDDSAGAGFLLGYHYMVAGFLEEAYGVFDRVVELEPQDQVARQLRDLAYNSIPSEDDAEDEETADAEVTTLILEPEEIAGTWTAISAEDKTITLSIPMEDGFTWNYEGAEEGGVLSGDWSIDESGLLVLDDEDAQLVAKIELTEDGDMKFVLVGSADSDPGLLFRRE